MGNALVLDWYLRAIEPRMHTKVNGRLGPADGDMQHMSVLRRVVECTYNGVAYEAEQRHADTYTRSLGTGETQWE